MPAQLNGYSRIRPETLRRSRKSDRMPGMDPHERATSVYYRVAGLVSREQKDLAVEIIKAEIRSAQHELLLEAAQLVLSGDPIAIAPAVAPPGGANHQAEVVTTRDRSFTGMFRTKTS